MKKLALLVLTAVIAGATATAAAGRYEEPSWTPIGDYEGFEVRGQRL